MIAVLLRRGAETSILLHDVEGRMRVMTRLPFTFDALAWNRRGQAMIAEARGGFFFLAPGSARKVGDLPSPHLMDNMGSMLRAAANIDVREEDEPTWLDKWFWQERARTSGPRALSPDGRLMAYEDGALTLVRRADRARVTLLGCASRAGEWLIADGDGQSGRALLADFMKRP